MAGHSGRRRCQVNKQKGKIVAIEWSALKVSAAMDMTEEFVNQADELLEQAKIVAAEAREIANLPQYVDQRLIRLIGNIERIDHVKGAIKSVRSSLSDETPEAERERAKNGSQLNHVL